jgi:ribosomal protein S21
MNVQVFVRNGNVDQALRRLRKKVANEHVMADIKRTEAYLRPGVKRHVKHRRVLSRARKVAALFGEP